MTWNIEKQNQLNQLLEEHKNFKAREYENLVAWFKLACGEEFTPAMLTGLLDNATQVIQHLKPWSKT